MYERFSLIFMRWDGNDITLSTQNDRCRALDSAFLPFVQCLVPIAKDRGQQVFDQSAAVGLDLDRHGHAGAERRRAAVDIDRRGASARSAPGRPDCRPDPEPHRARSTARCRAAFPYFVNRKRLKLDPRILSRLDEADVAVKNHCLNLEHTVAGHDDHQRLSRCDHTADRVDRQLLNHAVDGRRDGLQALPLLGFQQVLLGGGNPPFPHRSTGAACFF